MTKNPSSMRLEEILSDLLDHRGRTPKKLGGSFVERGVPVISAVNIKDGRLDYSQGIRYITREMYEKWMPVKLQSGDILMTSEAPLGELAYLDEEYEICIGQRLYALRADLEKVNPRYLFYKLNSRKMQHKINARATGTTAQGIRQSELLRVPISLLPIEQQVKVGYILGNFDNLIKNNNRRIEILEEMARAIYREWFVHFRFPGHEDVEMVDSELGEIPEGWKRKELGSIAHEVRRNVDPNDVSPSTPYVGLGDMPRKSLALRRWNRAEEAGSSKLKFKKGEILFGKIRAYFHKVLVAPFDGICSSDTIVIKPDIPDVYSLVLSYVNSDEFVAFAAKTSKGTKMPRADWDILKKYPVCIPPDSLLHKFDDFITDIIKLIHNLVFENQILAEMRRLLLPRIISGKIDVSKLDIEIPPSITQTVKNQEEAQESLEQWIDGAEGNGGQD